MSETFNNQANSRFLCFSLGAEEYAVPLLAVKEVIAVPEITPVPQTPGYFLGIMNLRGQVISVLDLRTKLSIKPTMTPETAVIICDFRPLCFGVVVDSVNSVLSPKSEDIAPKPEIHGGKNSDYITSVYRRDKRLVLFLDLLRALNLEDHRAIEQAAPQGGRGSQNKAA